MLFGAVTRVSGSGANTAPTIPTTMKPAMSRYVLCQPMRSERTRARAPETSTPIRQPTMEAAVPAPRSSSRRRSVRYASITMSWDAEVKATKKASAAIAARAWAGELKPMALMAMNRTNWTSMIHPRLLPSQGGTKRSMKGDQRNLSV